MTNKMLFISLPVADLQAALKFYEGIGLTRNPAFSDDSGACMVWSEAIYVMLVSHAKWRSFTQRPFPAPGSAGHMLTLSIESRAAVDAINEAAAAHGGKADVNPPEDHGFMFTRDFADPDGHMWAACWMDPAAMAPKD
ncbi:VOC family protein [Pelomonas sp. SE-A7]|uniref:VOC family protein n=1 Tax=Pelomonas sp. SE-A7 TaxID=3054953 RepID=UPI00259C72D0|nr:VOC family protein [Pelomonas sp. SE-A7]MDM4767981.1 VOC family protein [Pelomonas sp. SE-A7]